MKNRKIISFLTVGTLALGGIYFALESKTTKQDDDSQLFADAPKTAPVKTAQDGLKQGSPSLPTSTPIEPPKTAINAPQANQPNGTLKQVDIKPPQAPVQVASTPEPKQAHTQAAAPAVDTGKLKYTPSKGTSRQIAIQELAKGNYYGSVVAEVEGMRPTFYNDNIGQAVGYGWNWKFYSRKTIDGVAAYAGIPSSMVSGAAYVIGKDRAPNPPASVFSLSPEQAMKAVDKLRELQFEPIARKAIGEQYWAKLTDYQKAVAIYHVYKTGNYVKWPSLVAAIRQCATTQSKEDCAAAAKRFTYTYKMNGKVIADSRSQTYMGALFQSPQALAYVLTGKDMPTMMADVNKNLEIPIDVASNDLPADQIEKKDQFTPVKDELINEGKKFDLTPYGKFEPNYKEVFQKVKMPDPVKPSAPATGQSRVTSGWY